jgi:hypothetical protein
MMLAAPVVFYHGDEVLTLFWPKAARRQLGSLEDWSFHLLGGGPDAPTPAFDYAAARGARPRWDGGAFEASGVPSSQPRSDDPCYSEDVEAANLRPPMILLSSSFELFTTGALPLPGEIDVIDCARSALRVKLSDQDGRILARIAARVLGFKNNADGGHAYGCVPRRPRVPGFAAVKQTLTARERWHWAYVCAVQASYLERRELVWDRIGHHGELRRHYVATWAAHIRADLALKFCGVDARAKTRAEDALAAAYGAARILENELEYDQTIMYRRWAWLQVMSEEELKPSPVCQFQHSRARMLRMLVQSNIWEIDVGFLTPRAVTCARVDYELLVAEEARGETIAWPRCSPFQLVVSTDCLS